MSDPTMLTVPCRVGKMSKDLRLWCQPSQRRRLLLTCPSEPLLLFYSDVTDETFVQMSEKLSIQVRQ
ncbi:hypothetical protein KIPB_001440 [Kipferlia bialata]|uniref:Uncharacterized protein n=1 Tax=Kipferlia bialata TaxID=797122 RepID=A0A391NIR1_9EUKA|nr:hypothetical protein KIPB_001440 [Kipferlia bialata]|eukprot:g1440.t1